MKRVKGCLNSECSEYKKTYFKASDENCMICGSKLSYVCKYPECFKAISDDTKECYCPIHIAERKDKKDKREGMAKKVGGGLIAFGGVADAIGKVMADITKKEV